ncbi:MAG TPA: alpha/beta hydrolase [Roseiflexaceae bacterium]|nr:alpha/beta hydrolase [Roseiflexaceae bacterium]
MTTAAVTGKRGVTFRRWIHRAFLIWALFATVWLANSVRTQGVGEALLQSSPTIAVVDADTTLGFVPTAARGTTGLVFICGSGIDAEAYAPLLRPIAEAGTAVFIVKLPYRFAPLEAHKAAALDRVRDVIAAHPETTRWVLSGHSLGAALAARSAYADPAAVAALVLLGTTHPKDDDLSQLPMPVTKVYASNDGVARPADVRSNQHLLPPHTHWVEIKGGNHSQFGHYGHQLLDGNATISREEQQTMTRAALLEAIALAAE